MRHTHEWIENYSHLFVDKDGTGFTIKQIVEFTCSCGQTFQKTFPNVTNKQRYLQTLRGN